MTRLEELVFQEKWFPCGCRSDNVFLTPCDEHSGPVSTATNLHGTDPRLNVVHGPSLVTLQFKTDQGERTKRSVILDREGLLKVLNLLGELDLLDQDDDNEEDA